MMAWANRTAPDAVRHPRYQVLAMMGTALQEDNNVLPPQGIDITSSVERVRTTKMLTTPAGQFELSCTFEPPAGWTAPLSHIVIPGNMVDIYLDAGLPDTTLELVMRGWVSAVEENETFDGRGRPIRSISITGMDCGRFLLEHDMPSFLKTMFSQGDEENSKRLNSGISLQGSCGSILRQIFLAIFQNVTPILPIVEEGQLITEPILDNQNDGSEDFWEASIAVDDLWMANGKFWSALVQFADTPWNEIFGDYIQQPATSFYKDYILASPKVQMEGLSAASGGSGYYVIARRTPFSKDRWEKLPKTVLFDSEIKLARTHLTDAERRNVIFAYLNSKSFEALADPTVYAQALHNLWRDEDSMKHYGTIFEQRETRYAPVSSDPIDPQVANTYVAAKPDDSLNTNLRDRTAALWRWFSINHRLRSGAMVVAGIPSIRIGEKVVGQPAALQSSYYDPLEQTRYAFYVEGVIQEYVDGAQYLTHLRLTRGQPQDSFITARSDNVDFAQGQ